MVDSIELTLPYHRRWVPIAMGVAMFALGVGIPLLIREPAKGRYTPVSKACPQPLPPYRFRPML